MDEIVESTQNSPLRDSTFGTGLGDALGHTTPSDELEEGSTENSSHYFGRKDSARALIKQLSAIPHAHRNVLSNNSEHI